MPNMSPKVMAAHGANISAIRNSEAVVPVTLPLKSFREQTLDDSGTQMYGDTIPARDISLDKHAYEKWNP